MFLEKNIKKNKNSIYYNTYYLKFYKNYEYHLLIIIILTKFIILKLLEYIIKKNI